ncbi:hypothetical protein [Nitrososphaera viennensis]|uniref:Transmembrane protein n=2 Tax=Nitrososphaera viennensis TaxID=1034015 RepID=A0A060HHR6_9ARCH|nr:hypothetical protein [Nitrososphaera viennensis]AIC15103.1 hypothetical protein NVIE_008800 [Nitrososphaera viennensis EN76]UVS70027.1 hypothetical protein NWT39_04380 [Nitrososphaera viennensis]
MTAPSGNDESRDSPFRIMDEIIYQINKTKKMFILMIVTIMVIVPVSIVVIFATFGPPFGGGGGGWWWHNGGVGGDGGPPGPPGPPTFSPAFDAVRVLITVVVLVWLVLGIRQWFILSKWTKKYETYKELQKKIEDKLDFEKDEEGEEREGDDRR